MMSLKNNIHKEIIVNRKVSEDSLQQYWENSLKYHRMLPEFQIQERKQRKIDLIMSCVMAYLMGVLTVLIMWAMYQVRIGL